MPTRTTATATWDAPVVIVFRCPKCGKDILRLRSKRGRVYYRCDNYPDCDILFWDRPVNRKCPKCGFEYISIDIENGTDIPIIMKAN